jgi:hypothetical protein
MLIVVKTFDMLSQEQETERTINYEEPDARIWLSKHIVWACNAGKGIQLFNDKDEVKCFI